MASGMGLADRDQRLEWIALAWHAQLGSGAFRRLLQRFGEPRVICEVQPEDLKATKARLTDEQIARIGEVAEALPSIAEELETLEDDGVAVVCPVDEGYPAPLVDLRNPPPVVCLAGTWQPDDWPGVAVVGTRSPTPEGAGLAEALAAELTRGGMTVVSGLARGIDTAAHRGALDASGRTIAILGSGIRVIHPRENGEMAQEIAHNGAVISELSPRARPNVRTLMARNRLQAALSNAVVVVESGAKGGSLQTASDARRLGRLVYAVNWDDSRETSQGTTTLLADGALPLHGPDDVPDLVRRIREHVPKPTRSRRARDDEPTQLPLF